MCRSKQKVITMVKPTNPVVFIAQGSKTQAQLAAKMADDIKAVIYGYEELVPLALAVGVLRIVEREIVDASE